MSSLLRMSRRRWRARLALIASALLVGFFAIAARPSIVPGDIPGYKPDSQDYVYGAIALTRGQYLVDWDGPPRVPRYPPGFSALLVPAVALGGPDAAVWVPYASGLLLGLLGATIASLIYGLRAAPVALLLVWLPFGVWFWSQRVMSDLTAATLTMLELLLLMFGRRPGLAFGAGLLGGGMIWVRVAMLVVPLAALVSLGAWSESRRLRAWFLAGVLPPIALLGLWQLVTFGSPLVSGYQAARVSSDGTGEFDAFFSLRYLFDLPWRGEIMKDAEQLPNLPRYLQLLLGDGAYLTLPGAAVIGILGLLFAARRTGQAGVVGRFGLVASALTLAIYTPYFWQAPRFLLSAASLLNVGASLAVIDGFDWLRKAWARPRRTSGAARTSTGRVPPA